MTKQHVAELTPRTLSFRCGGVKINAGAVNSEMTREQLEKFSQLARITSGGAMAFELLQNDDVSFTVYTADAG